MSPSADLPWWRRAATVLESPAPLPRWRDALAAVLDERLTKTDARIMATDLIGRVHGATAWADLGEPEALERALADACRHLRTLDRFGLEPSADAARVLRSLGEETETASPVEWRLAQRVADAEGAAQDAEATARHTAGACCSGD